MDKRLSIFSLPRLARIFRWASFHRGKVIALVQVGGRHDNDGLIIIDEAGDLDYPAFLELKAFWNATEGSCGWFMIGADGLRTKIESGIHSRRVGFREIFSRFSESYASVVPVGHLSGRVRAGR